VRGSSVPLAAAIVLLVAGCGPSDTRGPTAPSFTVAVSGGTIGDRVWGDANGNGVQDTGEPGLVGWTVTLSGPGGYVGAQTTGANGLYSFGPLSSDSYRVCVTPRPGYTPTWDLDGVTTPNCSVVNLTTGRSRGDADFGYWRVPGAIGGRVWSDVNGNRAQDAGEAGLGAWVVQISGISLPPGYHATQSTDVNGAYLFTGLPTGTYVLCIQARPGNTASYDLDGVGTPNGATLALAPGQTRSDVHFGYWQPASLGGRLWNDANGNRVRDPSESGLVGWTVAIAGVALPAGYPTRQLSVANGAYQFGNLPTGNYKVCVTWMAGFTETYDLDGANTPDCATLTLPPGQNRSNVDFGYR
jgi:hypothetical protein